MPSELMTALRDTTVVFGHRGAKAYAPMNTLPSFELALSQGAMGIELDVHRSKDGHVMVIHDFSVDATTHSTGLVADRTLDQLKRLDAGAWFSPKFIGTRIPTLDEVFEAVGKRLFVNVEIKLETVDSDGIEQAVADCITRHAMTERVLVSSFNPWALKRFRAILSDVPLGFLYEPQSYDEMVRWMDIPYEAEHPYYAMVDEALVMRARSLGRVVNVWTVNDGDEARRLRDLGVSAIITDVPDMLVKALI